MPLPVIVGDVGVNGMPMRLELDESIEFSEESILRAVFSLLFTELPDPLRRAGKLAFK